MKAPDEVSAMLRLKALGFFGQIHERENFASQEFQGDGWGFHGMRPGDMLEIITTDPMSVVDMPVFCAQAGHTIVREEKQNGRFVFTVKRGVR